MSQILARKNYFENFASILYDIVHVFSILFKKFAYLTDTFACIVAYILKNLHIYTIYINKMTGFDIYAMERRDKYPGPGVKGNGALLTGRTYRLID